MRQLVLLLAAAALRPGARALTQHGRQQRVDPDGARLGFRACAAAALGRPECPRDGGGAGREPPPEGCLDSALLAEDMGELGLSIRGCAKADQRVADERGNPTAAGHLGAPAAGLVPKANLSHTKPVMWVHVHKSMGTFIYSLALLNGENVVRPSFNGNWWPYDTPDAYRNSKKFAGCGKRSEWFASSNATWGQIEHEVDDYNLCHDDFNYGIMLRDPNKLAISKASMEDYSPDETIASMSCLLGSDSTDIHQKCKHAAPMKNHWELWWFWDNFLVRTLASGSIAGTPAGAITEEHAHKAIERLSKFDVVMLAEDFEDKEHLERTIGWNRKHYEKADKRPSAHVVELTHEQDAQARLTNRFDYMVYDHFRSLPKHERVKKFK